MHASVGPQNSAVSIDMAKFIQKLRNGLSIWKWNREKSTNWQLTLQTLDTRRVACWVCGRSYGNNHDAIATYTFTAQHYQTLRPEI